MKETVKAPVMAMGFVVAASALAQSERPVVWIDPTRQGAIGSAFRGAERSMARSVADAKSGDILFSMPAKSAARALTSKAPRCPAKHWADFLEKEKRCSA